MKLYRICVNIITLSKRKIKEEKVEVLEFQQEQSLIAKDVNNDYIRKLLHETYPNAIDIRGIFPTPDFRYNSQTMDFMGTVDYMPRKVKKPSKAQKLPKSF